MLANADIRAKLQGRFANSALPQHGSELLFQL